ncbi:SusC/RagA family TonB-linked outer membrane protein [Hymenobacter terrenus]|uniref:SusC/RagA family TonB-linked outer membrane protein n=1 Tax=Hymenobacter terrenus TaxID=1629124 RepID=UPI00069767B1|nr:TonB-dependent receptor [Hymenobacter terrenus]
MMKPYHVLVFLALPALGFSLPAQAQAPAGDTLSAGSPGSPQYGVDRNVTLPIGFGQQPAWRVTSALSTVAGADLEKSFTTNLANTLFGRLPGLSVQQNGGEPGNDSPGVLARGIGTFGPGRDVLIMVDGFEGTYEQLVPSEIETISLLKDASATAIYGLRGANGVLLVTTKRGSNGPLRVDFSTQQGFHQATRLPQFLGSYDYARLYNEGRINDGRAPLYTDADLEAYRTNSDPYFRPNVNWYKEVLKKTAPISNYNLNFRGGSSTVRYFAMLNAIRSNGIYKNVGDLEEESINSRYSRFNFRSNVDVNVTKRLTAALTLGGTVEDNANPAANSTSNFFNSLATLPPNAFPVYNEDGSFGGRGVMVNPLANLLQTGSYTSNGRVLQSNLRLTEQLDFLLPGLSVSAAASFNNFFRSYSNKTKTYASRFFTRNAAGVIDFTPFGQNTSLVGDESRSDQWRNNIFQGNLNYDRSFGAHDVSVLLLGNSSSYTNVNNVVNAANSLPYKYLGLSGRATYTYASRYIAEFSAGYMGSEAFPKQNRYGFFPAASVGWIASNEAFLKGSAVVTFLKLRASYGLTGNDQVGGTRFMFEQRFPFGPQYTFGTNNAQVFGIAEGTPATTDLRWESEKKLNLGLELTLAQRFDLGLDVFENNRYDILTTPSRTVPQFFGVALPLLNLGKVRNRGFEATVRYRSQPATEATAGGLRYSVEASGWYAQNKIVDNFEAIRVNTYQYTSGQPVGQPFGLEALGLFQNQAEIAASPRQTFAPVQPGDVKYKDQNGDGLIDGNDTRAIGNTSVPTLTVSLHPRVEFRGFDLDALFQGVTGRTAYFGGPVFHAFQNGGNGQIGPIALDRWTPETAASATYPRLSATDNLNNYRFSSFWQRDGSFVKLRSLELGYTLPGSLLQKVRVVDAGTAVVRLFVNGTNLFSLDHMEGYVDPEVSSGYPALRTISGGLRVQF